MKGVRLLLVLALVAVAGVVASGFGARFGWWDYRRGFEILRWSTYVGFGVALLALVGLLVPRVRRGAGWLLAAALVIAVGAAAVPLYWLQQARALPPINDITTDLADPPAFVAILPLRRDAPVPASYAGAATAEAQRTGYPDIQPVVLAMPPGEAFTRALEAARQMGWEIVGSDAASGRIEATATTPWFGFKDDIVVRVRPGQGGSRVDVRSHSRVGRGDLGANARRIRAFVARLRG